VPTVAARANPITYLRTARVVPPFSVAQGSADCLVPVSQARQLTDALRAAHDRVDLQVLPGAVHADPRFDRDVLPSTIAWLRRTLQRRA